MNDFYFAVSASMIEKYGMPVAVSNSNHHCWELKHDTFLNSIVSDSPGKILDNLHSNDLSLFKEPVAICKAFIDDFNMVNILRCALVGDVVKCPVTITEMTWVNNIARSSH